MGVFDFVAGRGKWGGSGQGSNSNYIPEGYFHVYNTCIERGVSTISFRKGKTKDGLPIAIKNITLGPMSKSEFLKKYFVKDRGFSYAPQAVNRSERLYIEIGTNNFVKVDKCVVGPDGFIVLHYNNSKNKITLPYSNKLQ